MSRHMGVAVPGVSCGGQRAWQAGEQVFISYGPRSNDHLLQRYGFVEPNNPNDVYRITGLVDKVRTTLAPWYSGCPRIDVGRVH